MTRRTLPPSASVAHQGADARMHAPAAARNADATTGAPLLRAASAAPPAWSGWACVSATATMLDFDVVPGVPAAQSCAARVGAPLVNDTVSISLSDHLTDMPTIESRLHAAAKEGFTISIYNPWSRKRRDNYEKCCEILLEHRDPETPVGVVHAAGREDEQVEIVELGVVARVTTTEEGTEIPLLVVVVAGLQ